MFNMFRRNNLDYHISTQKEITPMSVYLEQNPSHKLMMIDINTFEVVFDPNHILPEGTKVKEEIKHKINRLELIK